ncbi:hypothetical protein LTR85_008233 [Meristemomyces frigidus]|nr:hypothetical protein LTR85_008233 [Meristemomyces frigidus]
MDASPLNRLPPELRNQIFELAANHSTPVIVNPDSSGFHTRLLSSAAADSQIANLAPLTLTCRQISPETAGLFLSCNTFAIRSDEKGCNVWDFLGPAEALNWLERFTTALGQENASALRDVVFEMGTALHLPVSGMTGKLAIPRAGVLSVLRALRHLANEKPRWDLKAAFSASVWYTQLRDWKRLDCIVQMADPVRSLAAAADRLDRMADSGIPAWRLKQTSDRMREWADGMDGG